MEGRLCFNSFRDEINKSRLRFHRIDGSKGIIKVNNQPYVPNLKFRLLAPKKIATDKSNNGLPEHEQTQMIINAYSSVLILNKQTKTKTIMHRWEMSIPVRECNIGFTFSRILTNRSTHLSMPGTCMHFQPFKKKSGRRWRQWFIHLKEVWQILRIGNKRGIR